MTRLPNATPPSSERLNKYVAFQLGTSRRAADALIEKGAVTINGTPAELGARVTSHDTVTVEGKPIVAKTATTTLLLYKPRGYVCSRRKQGDLPTIYALLPKQYHHLKPVGRLDADSSGVLLMSDDGDFAFRMTHPKFAKNKRYLVTLDQPLQPLHRQMIADFGVDLPDGSSRLGLERQHDGDDRRWIVTMSQGRNRQIRRTFGALGYTVTKLHRTDFGAYSLGDIKPGSFEMTDIRSVI